MKKWIIGLVVLVLVVGCAIVAVSFASQGIAAQQAAANATPTALPAVKADTKVVAQAKVVPVKSASLSLATSGIVAEAPVAEGQHVEQGQLLLRLESSQQAAAVQQAEANVKRAQAHVDELKAGPRTQEVAAAEAAVAGAQAALQKLYDGPDENQIIAAQAELKNAEAAVKQAQAAYDQAGGASNPYVGMLPTSKQLEQATNNYNAAKARFAAAQKGPHASDIAAAQAEVQRTQAQLELAKAGSRPETIAAAEGDLAAAQAALTQAKAALASMELHAPFAGTLATLNVKVGEQVTPGTAAMQVADFSTWQIETSDLTELNIVRVKEGSHVVMTFDAIPELELPGSVSRIRSVGDNRQGDIVYTVIVQPERMDERLRWNMTAQVNIEPK